MGMLHVHFTGGEPVARHDLVDLVATASSADLYTNLIASGIGLSRERLQELVNAGLDHIQLAFRIHATSSPPRSRERILTDVSWSWPDGSGSSR